MEGGGGNRRDSVDRGTDTTGSKIFLNGVGKGKGTTQADIEAAFGPHGNILRIDMPSGKDYCFVVFARRAEADSAIAAIDRRPLLGADSVRLTLSNNGDSGNGSGSGNDRRSSIGAGARRGSDGMGQAGFGEEWALWYNDPQAREAGGWEPAELGSISDTVTFMKVTAVPPRPLPPLGSLLLFRAGIKPSWDDPRSIGGGRVVLAVRTEEAGGVWSDLMAAALLRRFSFDREIVGVVLSRRAEPSKWDTLAIWTGALPARLDPLRVVAEVRRELGLRPYVKADYAYHQKDPTTPTKPAAADAAPSLEVASAPTAGAEKYVSRRGGPGQLVRGRRNSMPAAPGGLPVAGVLAKGPEPGQKGFGMARSPMQKPAVSPASPPPMLELGARIPDGLVGKKVKMCAPLALLLPESFGGGDGGNDFDMPLLSPVIELPTPKDGDTPTSATGRGGFAQPAGTPAAAAGAGVPATKPAVRRQRALSSPNVRTPTKMPWHTGSGDPAFGEDAAAAAAAAVPDQTEDDSTQNNTTAAQTLQGSSVGDSTRNGAILAAAGAARVAAGVAWLVLADQVEGS